MFILRTAAALNVTACDFLRQLYLSDSLRQEL